MGKDEALDALYSALDNDPNPVIKALRDGCKSFVPGDGELRRPKLIIVGEAPGAQEDAVGAPFVGKSGRFLDELLIGIGLHREEVWITNVVKYRPPDNRTPDPLEVEAFLPYLRREVVLVGGAECSTIVGLGRVACSAIAGEAISVVSRAGSWKALQGGWRLYFSCHPSWGIRAPANRKRMIKDFDNLGRTML